MSYTTPKRKLITLDEFTIYQTRQFEKATGELSTILRDIGLACKIINNKVNRAGLTDLLGSQGTNNIQGEEQQKLDVFANDVLIKILKNSSDCAGVASEENDEIIIFDDEQSMASKYVVLFDPLDGSSNIDVNASIGTIFAIYRRITPINTPATEQDFLQKGKKIVAAGYVIYGSSTILVYGTKLGVNGFTLDTGIGEFCLSHRDMRIPELGRTYSINQGNAYKYSKGLQNFLHYCMDYTQHDGVPLTHRYIGSMVADVHRTLLKGGLFMYPLDQITNKPKLRLLYECNPMSYIIEVAGGTSSTGADDSVLDFVPTELHERVPVYMGSKNLMDKVKDFLEKN
jgi:fructose-1,6-bisphosphatase I